MDAQRRTYQNAQLLKDFWARANQARSRGGRLALLRKWAALELKPDPFVEHNTPGARRQFGRQKQRGLYKLKAWCWGCQAESADHRHHIIPLAAGGRNRALNLVSLCAACHRRVHRKADHAE